MSYKGTATISFDESDPAGILFYGRYLALSHRHIEAFLRGQGIPWKDWYAHSQWIVPIRHVEANYLSPLFCGETYDVEVKVLRLGESSVSFQTLFLKDHQTAAEVKSTHVFIDKQSFKRRSIPQEIKCKL